MAMNVLFLHIPKTAGQSVHQYLVDVFGQEMICPARVNGQLQQYEVVDLQQYRVFSGHFDWNRLDFVADPKFTFTILRDPVERIVSFYLYLRREAQKLDAQALELPENRGKKAILSLTPDEYFADPDVPIRGFIDDHYDNFYTYYFAGRSYDARRSVLASLPSGLSQEEQASRVVELAAQNLERVDRVYPIQSWEQELSGDLFNLTGLNGAQSSLKERKFNLNRGDDLNLEQRLNELENLGATHLTFLAISKFICLDKTLLEKCFSRIDLNLKNSYSLLKKKCLADEAFQNLSPVEIKVDMNSQSRTIGGDKVAVSGEVQFLIDQAKLCQNDGNWKESVDHLAQALELKSDCWEAQQLLGDTLLNLGRYKEASNAYEKALGLNSVFGWTYFNLIFSLIKQSEFDKAKGYYQKLSDVQPNFFESNLELFWSRLKGLPSDFNPAVYLELNPDVDNQVEGSLTLARLHFSSCGYQEERFYNQDSNSVEPQFRKSLILKDMGLLKEAIFYLDENIRKYPNFFKTRLHLDTCAELGMWKDIEQMLSSMADEELIEIFFDSDWYLQAYSDLKEGSITPIQHFIQYGRKEGRNPHPLFDTSFYLEHAKEKIKNEDAFVHFLRVGYARNIDPHPCFLMVWYRTYHNLGKEVNPWIDYISIGWKTNRKPNWLFNPHYVRSNLKIYESKQRSLLQIYLEKFGEQIESPHPLLNLEFVLRYYKDVSPDYPYINFWQLYRKRTIRIHLYFDHDFYLSQMEEQKTALPIHAHYILQGEKKGLKPIPFFDPEWYREAYSIQDEFDTALEHFIAYGERNFHDPCPGFSTRYYLETHLDVTYSKWRPLQHFIANGEKELRRPHPLFDLKWYVEHLKLDSKVSAFQHFLSEGMTSGNSPHPSFSIESKAMMPEIYKAIFRSCMSKGSRIVPGLSSVFCLNPESKNSTVTPEVLDVISLALDFEREIKAPNSWEANKLKRLEPIARQYDDFDYSRSAEVSEVVRKQFAVKKLSSPLVTVIIPTRNRATVLKRAVNSVLSQTYQNIEVVIVDDGSIDGTEKLVNLHFSDSRVRYIVCPAKGVSAARNSGLKNAKGEYVAYLDSDNYWEPDHLEIVIKAMLLGEFKAAYTALRIFNLEGKIKYRGDEYNDDALRRENYIDMNIFVHHKDVIDAGIRFDETLRRCVDWDFILRVSTIYEPCYVPVIGCNYVDDSGALERITTNELSGDFFRVCQRNISLNCHIVGEPPSNSVQTSIIWSITNEDNPKLLITQIWNAVHHVSQGNHELIIINNDLSIELTCFLTAIAKRSKNIRIINFWRSFFLFPAANIAADIACGKQLFFWSSRLFYDAVAIEKFLQTAGAYPDTKIQAPLVVNSEGKVEGDIAKIDYDSAVLKPFLTGQFIHHVNSIATGIVFKEFPLLIKADHFKQLEGFRPEFSLTYGAADLCLRTLINNKDSVALHLGSLIELQSAANKPASSQKEALKELEIFRENWLGKLQIQPELPEELQLVSSKTRSFEVVGTNILPSALSNENIIKFNTRKELKFVIHCPSPSTNERESWGDYHYAQSMIESLEKLGHAGRIQFRDSWKPEIEDADVVIHLRGIVDVVPVKNVLNIMWIISHPEKIKHEEFYAMDLVLAPSKIIQSLIRQRYGIQAEVMMQATDPKRFNMANVEPIEAIRDTALFIGNSRRQPRPIVLDAIQAGLPVIVYGKDWDIFIDSRYVSGEYIPNTELRNWYGSAKVVLNDHWPSMRQYGIISNRLFDATASGGVVITDFVNDVEELFDGQVRTYRSPQDLVRLVESIGEWGGNNRLRQELSLKVIAEHSFEARMKQLLNIISL